jgi:hypothetical protein
VMSHRSFLFTSCFCDELTKSSNAVLIKNVAND